MDEEEDRLQVTFKLLNHLEPGIYQYGTRKVKVQVLYCDRTERKELQVAEVGNIFVPIKEFIKNCEKTQVNLMAKRALRSGASKEMALKRDRQRANRCNNKAGEGGKKSGGGGGTTVECLNYSPELNLIAFGGVQGKVGVLDATTVTFKGLYDAHNPHSAGKKGEG
jgi:hypothetical protein